MQRHYCFRILDSPYKPCSMILFLTRDNHCSTMISDLPCASHPTRDDRVQVFFSIREVLQNLETAIDYVNTTCVGWRNCNSISLSDSSGAIVRRTAILANIEIATIFRPPSATNLLVNITVRRKIHVRPRSRSYVREGYIPRLLDVIGPVVDRWYLLSMWPLLYY